MPAAFTPPGAQRCTTLTAQRRRCVHSTPGMCMHGIPCCGCCHVCTSPVCMHVCVCVHASSACVLSYAWFPLHACVHTQVDVHFSMHAHRCMAFLGMAAFPACTQLSLSWTHVHTSVCLPVAVHTHMHSLPHHACTHMHCTLRGCTHACTFPARTHSISQTHFQAQIRTEHLLPCQVPRAGC